MMDFQEIEMIAKDGILLFDNQRDIEKYSILSYKTYQISAIEEWGIIPEEMLFLNLCLFGNGYPFLCHAVKGYVNPCA
jgi:hypothetical protein